MTVIDGLTDRCLRVAARRWPVGMRDERFREWKAEMHMIRSDASISAWRRGWEQLRYAFSLASSPPAPDENRVPRGWRELVPRAGQWLRPWLVLMGMGVVCALLAGPIRGVVPGLIGMVTGPYTDPAGERPVYITVASGVVLAGIAVLAAWLGVVTGRRAPLLPEAGGRAARAAAVIGAPIAVGTGLLALDATEQMQFVGTGVITTKTWLYGPLMWMVLFAAVALAAVRLAGRGRPGTGRVLGIVVGLLVLEVLTIPLTLIGADVVPAGTTTGLNVVWWFPMSLANHLSGEEFLAFTGITRVMPVLLVASAFTLWYAIAASRVRTAAPAPAPRTTATTLPTVPRVRTGFALAVAVAGLAAWAVGIAYATPAGHRLAELGDSQFTMWASELRMASIVAIGLALGLAMVGHGRPGLTASTAAIGLLVTDTALDAFDRTGTAGLAGAVGLGALVLAAAWWLGRSLLLTPPGETTVRRGHIGIAVTAAMSAPFILSQATWPETASEGGPEILTPFVFPAMTTVVTVLLAALAGVGAVAARRRRVSTPVAAALVGVPVAVFGGSAVVSGQSPTIAGFGSFAMLVALLVMPYTAWLLAVIWWDRVRRPARAATVWAAIALAALPASVVVFMIGFMLSMIVAGPLMTLQGVGYPADGVAIMSGAVLGAIGMGMGVAGFMARGPRPDAAPVPESAPPPHGIPNGRDPHPVTS